MKGLKNGQLLRDVENAGYDVFLTTDQGIPYQQNFAGRKMLVQGAILGAGAEVGLTVFSNDAVAVLQPGLEASVERHVDLAGRIVQPLRSPGSISPERPDRSRHTQ